MAFVAELLVGECAASRLWRFVRGVSASSIALKIVPGTTRPSLKVSAALEVFEPAAILAALVDNSSRKALLGLSPAETALVVEAVATFNPAGGPAALAALEARAAASSYIAGPRLTAADALALFSAAPALAALASGVITSSHPATTRWLDQIYHEEEAALISSDCAPARVTFPSLPATFDFKSKAAAVAVAVPVAPVAAAGAAAADSPVAAAKPKKDKVPAAPPAGLQERSAISEMDFGVGVIVEAWPHPDSDKLWCEKISFGDAEPVREIASGIRAFFTHSQMIGARVVVVRNLKSRKLAGFASNGMVLCATSADGNIVEFVQPPVGAVLGERISFAGHEGVAAEPSRVDKKKVRIKRSKSGERSDLSDA